MNENNYPHRIVRSFMLRAGRMSQQQKDAINILWERYSLDIKNGMLDFNTIFNRQAPCILEIGFGMAHSLILQAQQNPECDFIGIEVHRPGIGTLLATIAELNLTNIRVFNADAVEVLKNCIPENSLDKVQLFFPDPWPKRRHHKRRLVQPAFVELIRTKLKPNGLFHLATDWEDYAQQMLTVLSSAPGFINTAGEKQFAPRPAERPLTKFEQRGKNLGHGVWDLLFTKT